MRIKMLKPDMTVQEMLDEYGVDLDALQSWLDTQGDDSHEPEGGEMESLGEMLGMTKLQVLAYKYNKMLKSAADENAAVVQKAINDVIEQRNYRSINVLKVEERQDGTIDVVLNFSRIPLNVQLNLQQKIQREVESSLKNVNRFDLAGRVEVSSVT